jgi:hypothetical protein
LKTATNSVTKNIDEAQEFTEEVAICPEVVILEVGVEVVQQQLLLLPFLWLPAQERLYFTCIPYKTWDGILE